VIHPEDRQFCRKYGIFRPHMLAVTGATSVVESLTLLGNEDAIAVLPAFMSHLTVPNTVMVPISDTGATWDLFVVWQRDKAASPLRTLPSELNLKSQ
jgi:hypothetical protein